MTAKLTPQPAPPRAARSSVAEADGVALRGDDPAGLHEPRQRAGEHREVVIRARFAFRRRVRQQVWSLLAGSPTLRARVSFGYGELVVAGPGASLDGAQWAECYGTLRRIAALCHEGRAEIASRGDFFARIHATG